jgi:sec-independent protein translocase protein TatA
MPFNIGPLELVIVLVIALLVIGPKRLPEMGNSLGKTIREFRKASTDVSEATSLEPLAKPAAGQEPAIATPAAAAGETQAPAPAGTSASAPAETAKAAIPGEPRSDEA